MSIHCRSCHGHIECLQASSTKSYLDTVLRKPQRIWIYVMWHLKNVTLWKTFKFAVSTIINSFVPPSGKRRTSIKKKKLSSDQEVLHLRPGELVEVKSQKEILATLDERREHKGLTWMLGQRKYCGKRYRVLKRVQTIRLESNLEMRKMKTTVLLQGAMCDGSEFYGCDRLCFYFWHEVWLRRVKEEA